MSRGEPFKRCGCTEVVDGKRRQLGQRCPKLRRSDGSWNPRHGTWAVNTSAYVRGKRVPVRQAGFASQTEAQRFLDDVRDRERRGVVIVTPRTDEYLEGWLSGKGDIKASTRRSYAAHLRNYIVPVLGHLRLDEIRSAHVAEMLAEVPVRTPPASGCARR